MYKQVTYKYRHFEVVVIFQMQETRVPEYYRADENKLSDIIRSKRLLHLEVLLT